MIKKGIKRGSAFLLAAVLVFSAAVLPDVYAALGVDTDAECSVEINVTGVRYKELNGTDEQVLPLPVEVNLYKVADIQVTGEYQAVEALDTLDFSDLSSETKAADWEALATEAKSAVDAAVEAETLTAAANATTADGVALVTDLETGLYLVDAKQVVSTDYQYDFTPYLISLPNNYYYSTDPADDTWVYDLTGENAIGLKPEKSERLGDLVINKELDVFNETIGGATFVFQVEASKTDIDTNETRVVYSDVLSMTFKEPGKDSITIQDLPAGSIVTVTEVYTGASYTVTSDKAQTVTILAEPDSAGEAQDSASEETEGEAAGPVLQVPVNVNFTNTCDTRLNGGSGVVNTFSFNNSTEEWTHSAAEDSTP